MEIEGKGKLLKIFIGEDDHYQHEPLYHAIIKVLKENGMAGGTVIKGIEGFGANSRIHSARILRLSEDLPVMIEVVDRAEKIASILPLLREMVNDGLIVIQDCEVILYSHQG
ncbi:MAG: DUF190 domain-containing protein [Halanaerobium sp.]|nr:DUF190 domain-containing protein [Halanaerobium sp.]